MRISQTVLIEGTEYEIVISDENEALLAAKAAGRAILGLLGGDDVQADYLIESLEDLDAGFLERMVRRQRGLPWIIAETSHLQIREFHEADAVRVPREDTDTKADGIFSDPVALKEYIHCQYGFFEFGIWALIDKESGALVGKAGLSCPEEDRSGEEDGSGDPVVLLELGYHIFEPYRGRGYAVEACRAILAYAREQWENCRIYAKIDASNEASIGVIKACGFILQDQTCSGALQYSYPCEPY